MINLTFILKHPTLPFIFGLCWIALIASPLKADTANKNKPLSVMGQWLNLKSETNDLKDLENKEVASHQSPLVSQLSVSYYAGLSQLQSTDSKAFSQQGVQHGVLKAKNGAVLGLGFQSWFNTRLGVELAWDHHQNSVEWQGLQGSYTGDYTSDLIHLNTLIRLNAAQSRPLLYGGLGLSWVKGMELDLSIDGTEHSYTASDKFGVNGLLGLDWQLNSIWILRTQIRWQRMAGINLKAKEESSPLRTIETNYNQSSIYLGFKAHF